MRITTTMLNETSRKTGIPIAGGSLLDYVNVDGNAAMAKALNKNVTNPQSLVQKSKYETLGKDAEALYGKMQKFSVKTENNIFEKAKESGDNSEIYKAIEEMAEKYNETMKTLKTAGGALNNYYKQMLGLAASDEKEALAGIGITIGKDGTLAFDKDKVTVTDPDEIAKVISTGGSVGEKVEFLAGKIADNADANIKSLSSRYNANGSIHDNVTGKYDFLG